MDVAEDELEELRACGQMSPLTDFAKTPTTANVGTFHAAIGAAAEEVDEVRPPPVFHADFPDGSPTRSYLREVSVLTNHLLDLQGQLRECTSGAQSFASAEVHLTAPRSSPSVGSLVYFGKSVAEWRDQATVFEAEVVRAREILKAESVPSVTVLHTELVQKRVQVEELLRREIASASDRARLETDLLQARIDGIRRAEELLKVSTCLRGYDVQLQVLTTQVSNWLVAQRRRALLQTAELTDWKSPKPGGSAVVTHVTEEAVLDAASKSAEGTDDASCALFASLKSLHTSVAETARCIHQTTDLFREDVASLKLFSKAMGFDDRASPDSATSPLASRPAEQPTPVRPPSFARPLTSQVPSRFVSEPVADLPARGVSGRLLVEMKARIAALEADNAVLKQQAEADSAAAHRSNQASPNRGHGVNSQTGTPHLRIQTPGSTLTALDLPSTGMFDTRLEATALSVAWSSGARVLFPLIKSAVQSMGWKAALEGVSGVSDTPLFGTHNRTNAAGVECPAIVFTKEEDGHTRLLQVTVTVSHFAGHVDDALFTIERDIGTPAPRVGETLSADELFAALAPIVACKPAAVAPPSQGSQEVKRNAPQPCQEATRSSPTTAPVGASQQVIEAPAPTPLPRESPTEDLEDAPAILATAARPANIVSGAAPEAPQSEVTTPKAKIGGRTFHAAARSVSPDWVRGATATSVAPLGSKRPREEDEERSVRSVSSASASKAVEGEAHQDATPLADAVANEASATEGSIAPVKQVSHTVEGDDRGVVSGEEATEEEEGDAEEDGGMFAADPWA